MINPAYSNTTQETQQLSVGQWNCNSTKAHTSEISTLLSKFHINILCLNETKLHSNINIAFDGYNMERKDRTTRGGGVATLIHNDLPYERINTLDHYNFEMIVLKVIILNKPLHVINIYIPPRKACTDTHLSQEFFTDLEKLHPFILCGDLNSHSTLWNCQQNNKNGTILEKLLANSRFNVINNRQPQGPEIRKRKHHRSHHHLL